MKKGLGKKLLIAGLLFLPVSAVFAYLSVKAQSFVHEEYLNTSYSDLTQLRSSLEAEWESFTNLINVYRESPLVSPSGRLDTIAATLRIIDRSSDLVRNVSLFDRQQRLVSSTNEEFLTFSSDNKGIHPGIAKWPLKEALKGQAMVTARPGDYESFYLLPIRNDAGEYHGVVAVEIDLARLEAFTVGQMTRRDIGFRLISGGHVIIEKTDTPIRDLDVNTPVAWTKARDKAFFVIPFGEDFLGETGVTMTLARDWRPVVRLSGRVQTFVLGTSCLTALLFFLGIIWSTKSVTAATAAAPVGAVDVEISHFFPEPSHAEIQIPDRPDRKAS